MRRTVPPSAEIQAEIWPRAHRQRCAVHRLRSLLAKPPKSEHDRVRFNYWSALTDATSVKDGKLRLKVLISVVQHRRYDAAAHCLAGDLDTLVAHLRYRSDTANAGGQQTSSRDRSARYAGARK